MLDGGKPTLSTIAAISAGGITRRIACWMAAKRAAVSSTRVPTGTRAWIRIWPVSTAGKKLLPRKGSSANEATTTALKPATKRQRPARASSSSVP